MQPAAGEENRLTKHFCLKISPRNLLTTLTRAASPISCIGPDENMKKRAGEGPVAPYIRGGLGLRPRGAGVFWASGGGLGFAPQGGGRTPLGPPQSHLWWQVSKKACNVTDDDD